MHLYDQLRQLQVIGHAYDLWEQYRKNLTEYLLKQTQEGDKLALLGIGRSNDIDLKILTHKKRQLQLVDKDKNSIEACIQTYQVPREAVDIEIVDFVGIVDNDYRQYADALIYEIRKQGIHTDLEAFSTYTRGYIEDMVERVFIRSLDLSRIECDYAVLVGVHSQLISMLDWIWQIMLQTLGKEEDTVRQLINKVNVQVIRRLHDALILRVNKGLIVGCELERVGREGNIGGAYQAQVDLQERVFEGGLYLGKEEVLVWPFNPTQGIHYKMQVQTYYKS